MSDLNSYFRDGRIADRSHAFLKDIIDGFSLKKEKLPAIIIVAHCYESSLSMIKAIGELGTVVAVIPKNSTRNLYPDVVQKVKDFGLPVFDNVYKSKNSLADGESIFLNDAQKAISFVEKVLLDNRKILIMDHGGYFAHSLKELEAYFGKRIAGILEFTDNGHKKYEKVATSTELPIISVAHSPLKRPADKKAGDFIAHEIDDIFREEYGAIIGGPGGPRIGLVGYGRIGSAAVKGLKNRGAYNIVVYDRDNLALINAPSSGFSVVRDIEHALADKEIIISATGAKAIKAAHYGLIASGVVIATATSPDDELDLDNLVDDGVLTFAPDNNWPKRRTSRYMVNSSNRKYVDLIHNGESPNTSSRTGIGDPSLFLPEGAYVAGAMQIMSGYYKESRGLREVSIETSNQIAGRWLDHFYCDESGQQRYWAIPVLGQ